MLRVLCIEDQPDIQTILKLTLEASCRFEVHLADSGTEGVASAAGFAPDAILLDYSLPDMDAPAVPVILLTVMTHAPDLEDCKAKGVIDTLSKPFNPRALAQQIATLLGAAGE